MVLQPTEYSVATLFASDHAVAICQTHGEPLKHLILLVREAGWGVVVVETVAGEAYLMATAARIHEGNLRGDTRKWSREQGYHFSLKRSGEQISELQEDVFPLPDGSVVEVRHVFAPASNFTHWGLRDQEDIPDGYVRF